MSDTPISDAAKVYCDLMASEESEDQYADMVPLETAQSLERQLAQKDAALRQLMKENDGDQIELESLRLQLSEVRAEAATLWDELKTSSEEIKRLKDSAYTEARAYNDKERKEAMDALRAETEKAKEDARYAWENTREIDKVRMQAEKQRDQLRSVADRLAAALREVYETGGKSHAPAITLRRIYDLAEAALAAYSSLKNP